MSDEIVSQTTGDDEERGRIEVARREKLRKIIELGVDPWGGRFDDRDLIRDIRSRAAELKFRPEEGQELELPELEKAEAIDPRTGQPTSLWMVRQESGEQLPFQQWIRDQGPGEIRGPRVRAAGRLVQHRDKGKLHFLDIQDWTGRVQLFVGKRQVGDENWQLLAGLDLGDLVGADGQLTRTRAGELSILVDQLHFLTKSIEPHPEKHHGLTDIELRQRMRYLDLIYTEGVLERFVDRTRIVQSVRETLNRRDFCEIEGPTLHAIAGGAAARPFATSHNALGMELYLRIALELHLKRLLVGGMERVYELGRVYRNEGISPRHNPEFTMLEAYQAYGDYGSMMDLTEQIIVDAIQATGKPFELSWGDDTIDFTPPFARRTYDELFAEQTKVDPTDAAAIARLAESLDFDTSAKHPDVVKNFIFEEQVEDRLRGPVFVIDYPASICPLTKRKTGNAQLAERFELFIQGMEIANAYTELNDPDLQERLFQTQLAGLPEEESMAKMDHDFIRALRHGMPPAGGLGLGIDRLIMLLTNSQTIRDVILFPLLRSSN